MFEKNRGKKDNWIKPKTQWGENSYQQNWGSSPGHKLEYNEGWTKISPVLSSNGNMCLLQLLESEKKGNETTNTEIQPKWKGYDSNQSWVPQNIDMVPYKEWPSSWVAWVADVQ